MGLLREIEAVPPFASVEELIALVAAVGETHVHIMVSNAPAEVALRLAEYGHGTTNLSTRSAAPDAALSCAEFARTQEASCFAAQHAGVSLRVWPNQVWLDGLRAAPDAPSLTTSKKAGEATRYNVKCLGLERSLELWLAEASGPVNVSARGILRPGLEYLLEVIAGERYNVDATLSSEDTLALARAHPGLPMSWAAGPFALPTTGNERDETLEIFHSVRDWSALPNAAPSNPVK